MKNLLVLIYSLLAMSIDAQNIEGTWNGILDIQGTQLTIIFNISNENDQLTTTMDSPDQGAKGIPTDNTSFVKDSLTIDASALGMKYTGKLSDDGLSIDGTFNQGPMSLPLVLSKEKVEKKFNPRLQDPKDFPYKQEEVKFKNEKAGHSLSGTLTLPEDGKFDKVVVLISGSGPQNRNEEVAQFNHRPFLVLSDHLTRNGIGVLRYDDRGVADSEGDFSSATSRDFADDVNAAVSYLSNRSDLINKKIGLVGHSEGGMIAPMVASENEDVDFITLLAGPGIPITELMLLQSEKVALAEGAPEEIVKANITTLKPVYEFMANNPELDKEELKINLKKIFKDGMQNFSDESRASMGDEETFIDKNISGLMGDWFLYFIQFDPAKYLEKTLCPVLAINGELDLQVTAKENLAGIKKSLSEANNQRVTIKEISGQNHLFQTAKTGAPSEYDTIEETFNEETMVMITEWIINHDK